jgi:acetyltransferase-like isoleucine patch superfamily enzyme
MTMRTALQAARARYWLRMCESVGEQPRLDGRPTINPEGGQVRIGHRFRLASRPVASHLVAGPGAILDIGNDVSIGGGAAIAAFEQVRIGDGTRIGPYVIIMDTNFHGSPGDQSVQHDTRPVTIGAGCRIGSRVTITRGGSIGDGAEILAGSVVSSAIPGGVCAGGGRARIIGRAGDIASRWDSAAAFLPELLMTTLGLDSPPDLDDDPLPEQIWRGDAMKDFLRALDERLGGSVSATDVREARTFADMAAAVHRAVSGRQRSEGRL